MTQTLPTTTGTPLISDEDLNAMDQSIKFPLPSKAKQGKNQEKHLYGLFVSTSS